MERLAGGIAMHSSHHGFLDAKLALDDRGNRRDTVRGTAGIREDVYIFDIDLVFIDTDDMRRYERIVALSWCRYHYFLGSCLEMKTGILTLHKPASRFDDHIDIQLLPRQSARILLGIYFYLMTSDNDVLLI